eukprot:m.65993 g.65993  ORF g.65993 m.65993 type:complete len:95 (+) comp12638_c0_seq2:995-1279(+)
MMPLLLLFLLLLLHSLSAASAAAATATTSPMISTPAASLNKVPCPMYILGRLLFIHSLLLALCLLAKNTLVFFNFYPYSYSFTHTQSQTQESLV